jgi:hypothetical protein
MRKLSLLVVLLIIFISACSDVRIDDEMTEHQYEILNQLEINGYLDYEVIEAKWFIVEGENEIYGNYHQINYFLVLLLDQYSNQNLEYLYYYRVSGLDESNNETIIFEDRLVKQTFDQYEVYYNLYLESFLSAEINIEKYNQVLGDYIIFNKHMKEYTLDEINKIFN